MQSYYATASRIRYYGEVPDRVWTEKEAGNVERVYASRESQPADPAKWKEPPHVFLANLLSDETGWPDPKALERFTRTYGFLGGHEHRDHRVSDPGRVRGMQTLLQQAWRGELVSLDDIEFNDLAPETEISFTRDGMELRVNDLWTLIRMLLLRDHSEGSARICAIADCPRTPYFLQARKGQRFCSHECAVLENVRRFRKAQRETQEKPRARKSKRRAKR